MMTLLARLGFVGACLQLVYGIAAVLFPHPAITDRGWELLWLVVNLGMIATISAWMRRTSAGRLTRWGGLVAIAGHALRALVSAVLIADPGAAVDVPIVFCIALMFAGMAALGVDAVRRAAGWAPLTTVATGVVTAGFYSFDKDLHFILLGLLWGSAWMWLSLVNVREATAQVPDPVGSLHGTSR